MTLPRPRRLFHQPRAWIPYLNLFIGISLTLLAAFLVRRLATARDELRFQSLAQRTYDNAGSNIDSYTTLLRSSSALIEINPDTSLEEFHFFIDHLNLNRRFPGIENLGFIRHVPAQELPNELTLISERFSQPINNFPKKDSYALLELYSSSNQNNPYIGFDFYSVPQIATTLERSRNSNRPVTIPEALDIEGYPSQYIIFMPVYVQGQDLTELNSRIQNLYGYVFLSFNPQEFLHEITQLERYPGIDFWVFDGNSLNDPLVYHSVSTSAPTSPPNQPVHYSLKTLDIAGVPWLLYFTSNPEFSPSLESDIIPFILSFGIGVSIILFVLSRSQHLAQLQTQTTALKLYRSQKALRESEQKYRLLVENASDLINVLDSDGVYRYVSASYHKTLGYHPKDILGHNVLEFVHPEDLQLAEKQIQKALSGKTASATVRIRKKDGDYITVENSRSLIPAVDNSPPQLVSISRDITQRVELEKRKDEFLGVASHELKTPVTSLKVYTQILKKKLKNYPDQSLVNQLAKMDTQLDKLSELISELLDITKIQAGRLEYRLDSVDLNQLIEEIVSITKPTSHHQIIVKGSISQKITADPDRITQVILNLITNAIKYSPKSDKIIIKLENNDQEATVCIKDFGIGISPDSLNHVFERFYRVHGTRNETYPGLGIGLYISAEIIKRHHGRIWAESQPDQGSTFCFTLPLKASGSSSSS